MNHRRRAIWLLMIGYVLFVLDLTWLQFPTARPEANLVPLRSMIGDWRLGGQELLVNFLGNIVVFIPIGMIPVLARPRGAAAWHSAVFCLLLSLVIELVQYASGTRTADVDDIILNTVGGILGYGIVGLRLPWRASKKGYSAGNSAQTTDDRITSRSRSI
jgi:glycopeptide antibiotics resistance protein